MRRVLCALVTVAVALGTVTSSGSDGFVLVRNSKNANPQLSRTDVKDLFIGRRKTWEHGALVQVILSPAGSPGQRWLSETVLGVPESVLTAKIRQEVFKGEMRKPVMAASDRDVIAAAASNVGGLGVVTAESARSLPGDVAVLRFY